MYTVYFLIGFMTSWGWWSAGKIQKAVDGNPVPPLAIVQQEEVKR
jgi:hypothetical protein